MSETIVVALITGGLSLLGVILSNLASARKTETQIRMAQAVTDTKLEDLTREVREHNGFAKRMPVVEEQVKMLTRKVEALERSRTGGTL